MRLSFLILFSTHTPPISLQANETAGYNAGDAVLRQMARVIQESIRATNFAFRYGGEEFLLVPLTVGLLKKRATRDDRPQPIP